MKKYLALALVGAAALGLGSVAQANVCAFDPVPAATLLYPFVAFDYNNPMDGTTTLFAVTNTSSEAEVVHFTLWTDYSVPILDWNVLLSGYDVQTTNIRDILLYGSLPVTVATASDTAPPVCDTATDYCENDPPMWDGPVDPAFDLDMNQGTRYLAANHPTTRCATTDPAYPGNYTQQIQQNALDLLRAWLQYSMTWDQLHAPSCATLSQAAEIGDWFGNRTTADVTWMYITADVVWNCNRLFPDASPEYWLFNEDDPDVLLYPWVSTDAVGQKRVRNVLMGDVFWLNASINLSEADTAIHLEANPFLRNVATTDPEVGEAVSFYRRYTDLLLVENDFREPLPTAWGFRYLGWHDTAGIDTWVRAFKAGTNVPYDIAPRCQPDPIVSDLLVLDGELIALDDLAYTYYAWDEQENVTITQQNPWSFPGVDIYRPKLLPLETQEVNIDQFNCVDDNGWIMFIWPPSNQGDPSLAWYDTDWYQTWMGVKYEAFGHYSAAMNATVLANFNCFGPQILPGLGMNFDYITEPVGQNVVGGGPVEHTGAYTISLSY